MVFHKEKENIGFSSKYEIPEWQTENVKTLIKESKEIRGNDKFSEFLMEITVTRRPGYYIGKVIFPILIIVAISWSVFWMVDSNLSGRMSVSLTSLLTSVAFQFVIAKALPRVSYFTFMDVLLSLSFIFMALTIFENLYVNILFLKDKEPIAIKIDHICRWAFPVVYYACLFLAAVLFLSLSPLQLFTESFHKIWK